jgi:transcriptional regulator with XRE-family HTH domain
MHKSQGEILKKLAKERGFTQEKLAEALNVSRASIQIYFKETFLKDYIIEKASEVLEVDKSIFYGGGSFFQSAIGSNNVVTINQLNHDLNNCHHELEKALLKIEHLEKEIALKDEVIKLLRK